MGMHVNTLEQVPYLVSTDEAANPTTTVASKTPAVGARWLEVRYAKSGGTTTGLLAYVAVNSYNSVDAATRLADAKQRHAIPLGTSLRMEFPSTDLLTRIDYKTDAASEAGATLFFAWGE